VSGWKRADWVPVLPPALLALAAALALIPVFALEAAHPRGWPLLQLQAQAFLHGSLDLGVPGLYDAVTVGSHAYLPFGPLPSVLLMPVVALLGTSAPLGWLTVPAVAVAGVALWLTFAALGHAPRERAWLVVASLAGTILLSAVPQDDGYLAAHVVAFACLGTALLLALRGLAPWVAGLLVGLAGLTRSPEYLAAAGIAAIYALGVLAGPGPAPGRRRGRRAALLVLAGVLPALAMTLLFDAARFGNPLESGYGLQALAYPPLVAARAQGLFSLAHLPKNLYYLLIASPLPFGGEDAATLRPPFLTFSPWGTGIFFVSPWLLAALFARGRLAALLAGGAALVLLPDLLYYGVGWIQFGYRYSLDAMPFVLVLAGIAYRRPGWRALLPWLALLSVAVNVWGTYWLGRLVPPG
jgi:hypothetical protein